MNYLIRRDRKALMGRLKKGEELKRAVQAVYADRMGLLAITNNRLIFISKRTFGAYKWTLPAAEIGAMKERRQRHGFLEIETPNGTVEFEMVERGAGMAMMDAIKPKPMTFKVEPKPEEVAKKTSKRGAHDPLEASTPEERKARLKRLLDQGTLSMAEYEWQMKSI